MKIKTIIGIKTKCNNGHPVVQIPISLERDVLQVRAIVSHLDETDKHPAQDKMTLTLEIHKDSHIYNIAEFNEYCLNFDEDDTINKRSTNFIKAFNKLLKIDVSEIFLPFRANEWFDGNKLSEEFELSTIMSVLPTAANIGEIKELSGRKFFYDYDGWHPVNTNSII